MMFVIKVAIYSNYAHKFSMQKVHETIRRTKIQFLQTANRPKRK